MAFAAINNFSECQILASHRILSAPVVTSTTNTPASPSASPQCAVGDFCGFIDVRDILSSFLQEVPSLKEAKMLKRMRILEEEGIKFSAKPIKDLKRLGSDGWFYSLDAAASTTLYDIIHDGFIYSKDLEHDQGDFGSTRTQKIVHRLAIFDQSGSVTQIVSQSDVVKFLHANKKDFGSILSQTVECLGLVKGAVISVAPETPALDAMALMEDRAISAVAVVNSKGAIIGNFSISELRTIMAEHFGSLSLPVGEFLALEHGTEYAGFAVSREGDESDALERTASYRFASERDSRRRESHPGSEVGQMLITCRPDSTFVEVLDKLVEHRLHRLYVTTEDLVPKGVITLTDILRFFIHLS